VRYGKMYCNSHGICILCFFIQCSTPIKVKESGYFIIIMHNYIRRVCLFLLLELNTDTYMELLFEQASIKILEILYFEQDILNLKEMQMYVTGIG
jgi:hypothetical protein